MIPKRSILTQHARKPLCCTLSFPGRNLPFALKITLNKSFILVQESTENILKRYVSSTVCNSWYVKEASQARSNCTRIMFWSCHTITWVMCPIYVSILGRQTWAPQLSLCWKDSPLSHNLLYIWKTVLSFWYLKAWLLRTSKCRYLTYWCYGEVLCRCGMF